MKDAVLLAGGLGTRLSSLSHGYPKALMEISGRPFIQYVLDQVIEAGCERVIMAVSYKWDMIKNIFRNSYRGIKIDWSVEPTPLGTGGAINLVFKTFALERAFVLNADTLFYADLCDVEHRHLTARSLLTVALRKVDDVKRFGSVELDNSNRIIAFREKGGVGSGFVNGGIYIIEHSVFNDNTIPLAFSFEQDILENKLKIFRPLGVLSNGYFIDIGTPEDLARARKELILQP